MVFTTLGCVLLAVLSAWTCAHAYDGDTPFHQPPSMLRAISALGVAFFGVGAAVLLWQMVSRRTALVLDADGLEWQVNGFGASARVRWAEVTGVDVYQQEISVPTLYTRSRGHFSWVRVFVQDADAVITRTSPGTQRILRGTVRMAQPATPVWLNCQSLPVDSATLASMVDEYLRAYRAAHPTPTR